MLPTRLDILFLASLSLVVLTFGLILFIIIRFHKQYLHTHGPLFKPRRPTWLTISVIPILLFLVADRPLILLTAFRYVSNPLPALLLNNALSKAGVVFPSVYLYTIHYDLAYIHSLLNKQWIVYLNPHDSTPSFYLRYKDTLGCCRTTATLAFFYWFIHTAIGCTVLIANVPTIIVRATKWSFFLPLTILVLFSACRLKNINDRWFIYKQFTHFSYVMLINLLLFVTIGFVEQRFADEYLRTSISCTETCLASIMITWFFIEYPVRLYTNMGDEALLLSPEDSRKSRERLRDALNSEQLLTKLMDIALRELSHETVLFMIEVNQLRDLLLVGCSVSERKQREQSVHKFSWLPKNEKFMELEKTWTEKGAQECTMFLFKKYMSQGCLLEVNLSYMTRELMRETFCRYTDGQLAYESMNAAELFDALSSPIREVTAMLRNTVSRLSVLDEVVIV